MNKKLEKQKKKKLRKGGGGSKRYMSTQMTLTDAGIDEKFEAAYEDAASVQLESMSSFALPPERWSNKARAKSLGVNSQYTSSGTRSGYSSPPNTRSGYSSPPNTRSGYSSTYNGRSGYSSPPEI